MDFPIVATRYDHVNVFVNNIAPIVCNEWIKRRKNGEKTISPAVVIAQGGKESGWNLNASTVFGIKGAGVELDTTEFVDGQYVDVKDSFASYPDLAGSVQGYYDLMQWSNYDDATSANTVEGELDGLTNDVGCAYATAPDYYETTLAIIDDFDLRVFNDYVWSCVESYTEPEEPQEEESEPVDLSDVANAVIRGDYGNGDERKEKLEADGFNYDDVQALVDSMLNSSCEEENAENEEDTSSQEHYETVQAGGSWWQMASDYMGDGSRYVELAEYNGMSTTDGLYAGMELKIPQ